MNDTIIEVFKIVGVLVIVFLVWQLTWSGGGVFATAYQSVAHHVNEIYGQSRGTDTRLLPELDGADTLQGSSSSAKNSNSTVSSTNFNKDPGGKTLTLH